MQLSRPLRHLLIPDWYLHRLLPKPALARIERAIAASERRHRGQVRFAVEATLHPGVLLRGVTARQRAIDVFSQLRIWDTAENNGVLIYLLLANRDIEIVADRGIDRFVGQPGWAAVCAGLESTLRSGAGERAVLDAVAQVSRLLEAHFPAVGGGANELADAPVILR